MNNMYRRDIDGLRGIAILSVIGFHYAPHVLKGGFAGVDVFFVISGYLITNILIKYNDTNDPQFGMFYVRRIKRIFPALVITLIIAIIVGAFFLLPDEMKALSRNVIAASTFTTNVLLLTDPDAGYFRALAPRNQLIHLWSLSIEEQFYILWPIAFYLIPKRQMALYASVLLALFMYIDIGNVFVNTFDNYYFPGTRFWEILAGAWLAVIQFSLSGMRRAPLFDAASVAGLEIGDAAKLLGISMIFLSVFFVSPGAQWPGYRALLPVIGAMLVINFETNRRPLNLIICNRFLTFFGLISFPLYLYHWLFLSLSYQLYSEKLPEPVKLAALAASCVLAAVTFKYVETPVRRGAYGLKQFLLLPILMIIVFLFAAYAYLSNGFDWRFASEQSFNDIQENKDFSQTNDACLKTFGHVFPAGSAPGRDFCLVEGDRSDSPVIILGDSHASKLYQGFLALGVDNIIHLGRGSCAPVWNLETTDPWYQCQPTINNTIIAAVNSNASLLILTGVFERYFDGTYGMGKNMADIGADVRQWLDIISKSGKRALIVLDNPSLPFNGRECMRRPVNFNQRTDCSFDRSFHDQKTEAYKNMFRNSAQQYDNISIIDPAAFFCDQVRCSALNKDGLVYDKDDNHLNTRGSIIVDQEILRLFPAAFHFRK